MRLFVSEYLSSGAVAQNRGMDSLLTEGRSMLLGVVDDFSRIPNCHVCTTWDRRLGTFPLDGIEVFLVDDWIKENAHFEALSAECDFTFTIAPECDRILASRRQTVDRAGGRWLGSSLTAIELAADKLRLANFLLQRNLPTIATVCFHPQKRKPAFDFPFVVKPRFGAGSQQTYFIGDAHDFEQIRQIYLTCSPAVEAVAQPFVPGEAMSNGFFCTDDAATERRRIDVLLPAEQLQSDDGTFRYLGGRIDRATPVTHDTGAIEKLVRDVAHQIPGLGGYVGIDYILPPGDQSTPVIVEINPRLTTSYLGYRRLAEENLAARLLPSEHACGPVKWKNGQVSFAPDGTVTVAQSVVS